MHRKSRNPKYIIILLIVLILLGIPSYFWLKKVEAAPPKHPNPSLSPVIMIPGSSATADQFDSMINNINNRYHEHHSTLKVTVQTDNTLIYSDHIRKNDLRPFIVVAFQNNLDGPDNIKKQAIWFNLAFNDLQKKYHFKTFNAFGHSNGSLIWTYFLENSSKNYNTKINHLMTVGAPYNLEESNISNRTDMLKELIKHRNNIPSNLSYDSIAGTEIYSDDGIVPIESVNAGKYIYERQIKRYTFITLTGSNAEHSDMLLNKQFISLFHQYIIKGNK